MVMFFFFCKTIFYLYFHFSEYMRIVFFMLLLYRFLSLFDSDNVCVSDLTN